MKFRLFNFNKGSKVIIDNVFWALLGKFVSMANALIIGVWIARYLGPAQYGLMNYVISYVAIFSVLGTFGLTNIEVRELSKSNQDINKIIGTCFGLRIGFALIAYIMLFLSLLLYEVDAETFSLILLYGLTLFTTGCFEIIRNYFTSIVKNEYIAKSEISRILLGAIFKVVLLLIHASLPWFVFSMFIDTVLIAGGYYVMYKGEKLNARDWSFDWKSAPFYIKNSFPLLLASAIAMLYQKIDQVMLGNMLNKESVGYFATAAKFLELILFLPTILTQTLTPYLVKSKNNETLEQFKNKSQLFMDLIIWLSIILSFVFCFSSSILIEYTFGYQYYAAIPVLQILSWKTVCVAMANSSMQLIIIDNKQKYLVFGNILSCIACISLNYWIIPVYGVIGSALVTIITVFIGGCLSNVLITDYRPYFYMQLKSLLYGLNNLCNIKKYLHINT